jgi:hypothetical protein
VQTYERKIGGSITGELIIWRWQSGTIATLEQRCGSIDESCLIVVTKSYQDASAARDRKEAEKSKRQF